MHLASLVRDIAVGDLVVLEVVGKPPLTTPVTNYQETVWYANADDPANSPQTIPGGAKETPPTAVAIPVPHSFITLEAGMLSIGDAVTRVWYGYRPVSELLDEMPASPIPASNIANYNVQPAGAVRLGSERRDSAS